MKRSSTILAFAIVASLPLSACAGSDAKVAADPLLSPAEELQTAEMIPELMEAFDVSGLAAVAVRGDTTFLAKGYGTTQDDDAFTAETRCGLYSATKFLASLTYADLEARGLISLDATLGSYVEDAPKSWSAIPFYTLLNHSSGITMVVNKSDFGELMASPNSTNAIVYEMIRDEPLEHSTGEFSRYRQSGYAIGEMILERHLGQTFAELVEEIIAVPARLDATTHPSSSDGTQPPVLLSAGGYETNAYDMAKLFKAINSGKIVSVGRWKSLLLDEQYRIGDYSLGSVIQDMSDVLTVGHSGGGARANIRYAPDAKIGVMVCTDDRSNNRLAMNLANMLIEEITTGRAPKKPILAALTGYADLSADEVIAAYERAQSNSSDYDFSDTELVFNEIGYTFLAQERNKDAVKIFALNATIFPRSPNAHDSWGEALLATEDLAAALARYQEVLRLNPENKHAGKMIDGIRERLNEPQIESVE